MISDVFLFPDGTVAAYSEAILYRENKTKHGKHIKRWQMQEPKKVPMLSGDYSTVKFKLLPAINSCSPKIHGDDRLIQKDMRRFCIVRRKMSKQELEEESDKAMLNSTTIAAE